MGHPYFFHIPSGNFRPSLRLARLVGGSVNAPKVRRSREIGYTADEKIRGMDGEIESDLLVGVYGIS